jgi:hypothetical protein
MMLSRCERTEVVLVALEYGGQWRSSLANYEGVDLIMIVQVADEDPLAFARRLLEKMLAVVARGSEVIAAVLAVAPTIDTRRLAARSAIARTLLRVLRRGSRRRLQLVEPDNASADCRAHLVAIAEGLAEDSQSDCEISVGPEIFGGVSLSRTVG